MRESKFFDSIGRKHPYDDEMLYFINEKKRRLIFIILNTLMDIAECDFYRCEFKADGTDALLSVQLSSFYIDMTDAPDRVISILGQANELTFIPGENHMTVRVRVKDFYDARRDEGCF